MNSTTVRLAVKSGACMRNGGDGRICALQPKDCPADATFATPRSLDQAGGGLAHGGACTTRTGTEITAKIGWCANEGCTGDASSCTNPSTFTPVDDRCTTREGNETLFGRCGADSTCYWSSSDCQSIPSSWVPAYDVSAVSSKCTCDSVRVGACFDNGFHYCAVMADSCDEGSVWIDAVTLQDQADTPDCFLCREESGTPLVGGSTVEDLPPASAPTPAPLVSKPSVAVTRSGEEGLNQQQAGWLAATLGIFVGLTLLFGGCMIYIRRRRARRTHDRAMKEQTSDLPASENPTVTEIQVAYQEDECLSDIEA